MWLVFMLHADWQLGHRVQLSDSIPRAFDANTLRFEELISEVYCTILPIWSQSTR